MIVYGKSAYVRRSHFYIVRVKARCAAERRYLGVKFTDRRGGGMNATARLVSRQDAYYFPTLRAAKNMLADGCFIPEAFQYRKVKA